jgi:deoxyribodipyrimidine photolyase-related protein
MSEAVLIYPHQLFARHPALAPGREVWLVEDELFFGQLNFHPLKLAYHRASMAHYRADLEKAGYAVQVAGHAEWGFTDALLRHLSASGVGHVHLADPADYLLERRLRRFAGREGLELVFYRSPGFLLSREEVLEDLGEKRHYLMASFYIRQRRRHGLLLEAGDKPLGGSWSYDAENRKKLPKGLEPPPLWMPEHSPAPPYPVTRPDALRALDDFCTQRLAGFGAYQDALDAQRPFLFHAVLTPALNAGLITPDEVLRAVLERHAAEPVPLPALEGFIRQLIGWREFMRGVYLREGSAMRRRNFWGFSAELPAAFARGRTGFPPLDDTLRKVDKLAYAHHIERLMVLGNFLLLTETHPDAVYRWFMERFIDAYDWVMVPNVYGMSQYADGGLITTKPYLSGSNYLRKQSHYAPGPWCEDWDALFWRFIGVQREVFYANPRMRMMASLYDKMPASRRAELMDRAERVLERLRA